jgi:dipeptidyl aminopeptidase/acylaminoacyl peptidase
MLRCLSSIILALAGACMPLAQAQAGDPPIPAADFFRVPQLSAAKLSPSGKLLAVKAAAGGSRVGLFVFDLTQPGQVKRAAGFADADIRDFDWVNEQRLVFRIIDHRSGSADQRYAWGLYSVKPDGSEQRMLIKIDSPFFVEAGGRARREALDWNHDLLEVLDDGGDEVIIGRLSLDSHYELREVLPMRLNVVDGRVRNMAQGMPDRTSGWLFDAKGEPRVAIGTHQGRTRVLWREPGREAWEPLADFDSLRVRWTPRFLDAKNTLYVTRVNAHGYNVLTRFDPLQKKPIDEAFVSAPGFDFHGELVTRREDARLLGVHLTTDGAATVWLDETMKRVQVLADERLPGRSNRLSCRRCGQPDQVVLVHSWSDRDPGQYHVYEAATQKWTMVGRAQPQIDPRRMAQVSFERVKARDGRDLPLWLTLPAGLNPGAKPAQPRPAVVMVHGGPWVRGGHWRWDPMDQFLASRGYVVIKPEFRGSTGYGAAHFRAGWKQWGRAMQDDVADALQWAVQQGVVDPKRVCIAGASYGGYATLMGLVRHPDLYRCGVAWVAVTDVELLFKSTWVSDLSDEARLWSMPSLIGDPTTEAEMLREASPVNHAARIKAPLLLAFGHDDRRVPLEHGLKMRAALREAGREPEWVVYPGEGHGWLLFEHRVDFAQRIENFLAQHLRE